MFPEAVNWLSGKAILSIRVWSAKAVDDSLAGVEPSLFDVPVVFRAGSKIVS